MASASSPAPLVQDYGYTAHRIPLPGRSLHLHYLDWQPANPEQGSPTTLLLLHGLGDCAAIWSDLGQALAQQNYRVIAPDLRGHGDSDKPDDGYDFDSVIDDLEALLDALDVTDPIVAIGHSWAGKLVPLWVKRSPEKFRAQILVDPFFIGQLPKIWKLTFPLFYKLLPFLQMMGPFETQAAAEAKAKTLKQYRDWSPLQQHAFYGNLAKKSDQTWGSKLAIAARNGIFEAVMLVSGLTDPLATPALVLIAEEGLNRSEWQLRPYRQYLTNLTLKKLPGNHWLFLVNPQPFAETISHYLKQQIKPV